MLRFEEQRTFPTFLEMAANGIAHVLMQAKHVIRLREDRMAERAGEPSALRRFFDERNYFVHSLDTPHMCVSSLPQSLYCIPHCFESRAEESNKEICPYL